MKIRNFFRENKILILSYFLLNIFFFYQHYKILNWDFTVYILNAKYLFFHGNYFEWIREPLTSLLLGIFGIFSWKFSPYFYILLVSFIHLLSSIKLSEKFNIDKNIYYLLSLSPFLLIEGLKNGTELLSLSLIQLFLAYFNTSYSPIFLGLAFLTRYTSASLLPLILFLRKPKKIIIFLIIFILTLLPWLIFNYIKTGNALMSIVDTYALNITFRDYISDEFPIWIFIIALNYSLIFFIIGFIKKIKNLNQNDWIMISIFILTLISFMRIPVKNYTIRYIFLMIIPLTYFSAIALQKIKKRQLFVLFTFGLLVSFFITANVYTDDLENYRQVTKYLGNCSTYSNNWVYLNHVGKNTKPDLNQKQFKFEIEKGERILMYYNNLENPYVHDESFIKDFPVIIETGDFILFGDKDKCNPEDKKIDSPYIYNLKNFTMQVYNYSEDISNCNILFQTKLPLICKSKNI